MSLKQMTDKQIELLSDAIDSEFVSDCCGAPILMESFCTDCKEHCGKEPWGINVGYESQKDYEESNVK